MCSQECKHHGLVLTSHYPVQQASLGLEVHSKIYSNNDHIISAVFQETLWIQKKQGRVLSPEVVSTVPLMAFRNLKKKTFKHTNTVCSLSDSLTITDSVVHCTEYRIKQLEIDNLWGQIHTFNAPWPMRSRHRVSVSRNQTLVNKDNCYYKTDQLIWRELTCNASDWISDKHVAGN